MKKVLSFLFVIVIISTLCAPAFSAADARVIDDASLLSDSELTSLTSKLDEISERQDFDVVVVTTNTLDGKSAMEYADDYYDYNNYRYDGCLLLVSMEDRDWWISTKGYGITALTDYGISYIGDEIVDYLSDAEYFEAFEKYSGLIDNFVTEAKNDAPYDTNHEPKSASDIILAVVISLIVGLVIAIIVTLVLRSRYKPVRLKKEANDYFVNGSLILRRSFDHFIYSHVTRERKSDNSNGSGSSTHTSSSGSIHGGGGGKF
ncbi:MAG: TPM domain-containing protein [Ruminococcus sp.]|nr:TPM domain-containing protein [Ruminococcus sp.]